MTASFIPLQEPGDAARRGFALFALGFRPFYLLAAVFAAISVPLWALQFCGLLPHAYLRGPLWHAHEMLFGFALAVIVGFLFTAGRNWTDRPTPTGAFLAALAALWIAARVLVLTPWALAAALANVAFPLAAAACLAVPFWRAGSRRNYFFVALLAMLAAASGAIHASLIGGRAEMSWAGLQAALDIVLFIVSVMAGRVLPMFTNNGVPGANATRRPWLEKAALGSVLALLVADVAGLPAAPLAAVAALACIAHAGRWLLWQPWKTLRTPLVGVLHLAYAWIPLHLALRALACFGTVPPSIPVHALTVGAVGGLVIGMITRTAKGHTARPLRADRVDATCYALVLLAAVVRVGVPLCAPALTVPAVLGSALLWSAGFGLYAVRYAPILARPRLDGRPG